MSSIRRKNIKANKRREKRQTKQNGKEEQEKVKTKTKRVRKVQTQNFPRIKLLLTNSMQALPLR
jgi:hypothetical protein